MKYIKTGLYFALLIPVFILAVLSLGIDWAGQQAVALMNRLENEIT